jgi:PAS domain S-box-containing protein
MGAFMGEQAQWSTMRLDESVIKPDLWQDGESAAQLRQSAARYQRLVEVSPHAIFINRANRLVFINAAGIALLGATDATQLLGKSPFDLFHPASHGIISERIHLMLTEGRGVGYVEEVIRRLDGTPIHVEVAAVPFTDHDGTPVIQVILHDITHRKQAEALERAQRQLAEALRASLAALTSSLNVEKVMEVPCDGGSIILFEGNTGRVAYLRGFAPDAVEFFRKYRFELNQLTGDAHRAAVRSYIVSDTRTCADWLALPPTQWVRSSLRTPIKLRGSIIGMLVLDSALPQHFQATDIEKLEAFADHSALALENANQFARLEAGVAARTAELQQAKEQVEAILNSSPDGIVLVDPALQIQQSNSAWLRLFDCPIHHCAGELLLTSTGGHK